MLQVLPKVKACFEAYFCVEIFLSSVVPVERVKSPDTRKNIKRKINYNDSWLSLFCCLYIFIP